MIQKCLKLFQKCTSKWIIQSLAIWVQPSLKNLYVAENKKRKISSGSRMIWHNRCANVISRPQSPSRQQLLAKYASISIICSAFLLPTVTQNNIDCIYPFSSVVICTPPISLFTLFFAISWLVWFATVHTSIT